ncbi:SAM-dependent DNA methyltransferase [Clostridioides difficile]|uniref:class I SAM-dependent DNA methyltransferase n=1 Tax=Clostridioides difficile TaxID=1496 RepID=UPI0008A13F34|nr:class I SAM-dependent DNA methyltransferase [Clostridioides difficile]OFU30106.1 restriction endonuclease subunit M [Clostridium sp. HMSC19B11]EGT3844907.1 SAM-dependent DNA methyltransferase [Clostridioides difficile]EGT4697804.1 SAM-dependent DNA methyltransferase [Clostridioides difficile]EGT4914325.1 SAM-dependent DNA methyltransferase [Clostridioides difficile]EGT5419400.1 SAM-dependent DNA methyltransferase [Clostridioides difficile]
MSINNLIKRLQNIMRQDAGVDGDAQRIAQIVWILFLKVYDAKEELWEFHDDDYESIIPENLRWREWAVDEKDGQAMTGDALLSFVNDELFPTLKNLEIDETTEKRSLIVKEVFEDAFNYMKDGTLLRQVINVIDEIDFTEAEERHSFNDIYETILKDLQSAGKSGEFYSPRPTTSFIAQMLNPKIGDKCADFACGTGGFLISILELLIKQINTVEDKEIVNKSLYGVEKKNLPHLLCITNLLLHDIDSPNIIHGNSLEKSVRDYKEEDRFDVIAMNPPYGGVEQKNIQSNFPVELQTSETADLFVTTILYRLKQNGRCGIILPDNFLFGTENSQKALKEKLMNECNLHTIVKLPAGVFAPYTSITTNMLFFDKTGATEKIHYYDIPLPKGYKSFSKTKPFRDIHLDEVRAWWNDRDNGNENAYVVTKDEVIANGYNLDFKNPNKLVEEHEFTLEELLSYMDEKSKNISSLLEKIAMELEGVEE